MILYKTIALKFGHFLENGTPADMLGPDGKMIFAEEVRQHWRNVLYDISSAKIYLLDYNAANYLDSLRMDIQGMPWEDRPEADIEKYVREIELPRDLVWIEYDDRKLWEDRCARGMTNIDEENLSKRRQRGFLIDNRSSDKLSVRLFSALNDTSFFDAPFALEMSKSQEGRPDFNKCTWHPQRTVLAGLMRAGLLSNETSFRAYFEEYEGHLSYEMVIGFMLFAALAAREDDLMAQEVASLSTSQVKTARKFGKVWMTDALKSHVTIRIGPAGERHLSEQAARRSFEQKDVVGRNAPTEHWVAEHERRYSNGKVVRVRAHKRGIPASKDLPTRVVAPGSKRAISGDQI